MGRRLIWTDELADRIARNATADHRATWIAWLCVTAGPLALALLLSAVL